MNKNKFNNNTSTRLPLLFKWRLGFLLSLLIFVSCNQQLKRYSYPTMVETSSKKVERLPHQLLNGGNDVVALANFDGARCTNFRQSYYLKEDKKSIICNSEDTSLLLYTLKIPAENTPINSSPWYSFGLMSKTPQTIILRIKIGEGKVNRYYPKSSRSLNGPWTPLPFNQIDTTGSFLDIKVSLDQTPLYLSSQEVLNSTMNNDWLWTQKDKHKNFKIDTIGYSVLGKPLLAIDTKTKNKDNRPTLMLIGRQHPPEIPGYIAFKTFFEELFSHKKLSNSFLENFRIVAIPMLNPDGVDEGHWRHNMNGIDLNRDWANYNQPEVLAAVTWLQNNVSKKQGIWGLDFHSTQYDVLYTKDTARVKFRFGDLQEKWIKQLSNQLETRYEDAKYQPMLSPLGRPLTIGQDTLRVEAEVINKPTAASWFAQHYNSVGITYEVGDEQDRKYVKQKAKIAAEELMQLLLKSKERF